MLTDKPTKNEQNYTNFKSNDGDLSLSSLNSIGQSVFQVESGNENGQTEVKTQQSNRRIGYTQPA